MKVAITGHTSGIGKSIYEYFYSRGHIVLGFSRSNGYDISDHAGREKIAEASNDCDIFVNNAYSNFDSSQLDMLGLVNSRWNEQDKLIINISSRYTIHDNMYCKTKSQQDQFCDSLVFSTFPRIINLKPGLTDTPRVKNIAGNKMETKDIVFILDFVISNMDYIVISSINFGK